MPPPPRNGTGNTSAVPYLRVSDSTFLVAPDEVQAVLYWATTTAASGPFMGLPSLAPFRYQYPVKVCVGSRDSKSGGAGPSVHAQMVVVVRGGKVWSPSGPLRMFFVGIVCRALR